MRRYLHRFDRAIMDAIARLPRSTRPWMLLASLLGHPLVTVTTMLVIFLYGVVQLDTMLIVLCCIALATFITSSLMKLWLRRARPKSDYVHSMWLQTFSFPSGHAAGSLVCFGLVAYLAALGMPQAGVMIGLLLAAACFWVGISRVYLGAHYPSDVIGGWVLGAAGLAAIMIAGA